MRLALGAAVGCAGSAGPQTSPVPDQALPSPLSIYIARAAHNTSSLPQYQTWQQSCTPAAVTLTQQAAAALSMQPCAASTSGRPAWARSAAGELLGALAAPALQCWSGQLLRVPGVLTASMRCMPTATAQRAGGRVCAYTRLQRRPTARPAWWRPSTSSSQAPPRVRARCSTCMHPACVHVA